MSCHSARRQRHVDHRRQCTKAGVDCMFWDHGRNEYLPRRYGLPSAFYLLCFWLRHVTHHRSYIAELVHHVRRLTGVEIGHPSPATFSSPATSAILGETPSAASSTTAKAESVLSEQHHFDHHFALAGGSYRYLGAESCLVKSPRLHQTEVRTPEIPDDADWELTWKSSSKNYELVLTYLDVVQPLYPILDPGLRFLTPEPPSDLDPTEIFCLNMIYSIGCYMQPGAERRKDPKFHWKVSGRLDFHHLASEKYRCLAETFFNRAMEHLEASTVDPTITTLRAVLLLAINSLFDPKSGNIGQQVALATRLAMNLEAKVELQELGPEDVEMIRNMHATIFSIENEIASTLDRPATFPEPVCTPRYSSSEY